MTIPESVTTIGRHAFFTNSVTCGRSNMLQNVFYQGTGDVSTEQVFSTEFNPPGSKVLLVCVPPEYPNGPFCSIDITQSRMSLMCQQYESKFNLCDKGAMRNGELISEKRKETRAWEEQSDGCMDYVCVAEGNYTSWSACNSSEESTRICYEHECVNDTSMLDERVSVVIQVDPGCSRMNVTDFIDLLTETLPDVDPDTLSVAYEMDEQGVIIQVIIFAEDEETAEKIANAINSRQCEDFNSRRK